MLCVHAAYFFLQFQCLGGWDHPLKTDRMVSSNLSWWLREYLPEQKCVQTTSTEQTRCLHFQEAILPDFDTELLQLCLTWSVRNTLQPRWQICQLFFTGMQRVYVPGWTTVLVLGHWWLNNVSTTAVDLEQLRLPFTA